LYFEYIKYKHPLTSDRPDIMPTSDTIDFLCKSCHCKLQVPAALAGVSGPCPRCNSQITAPSNEPRSVPSNKTSLPPKRLPEHIPSKKIRAAAEAIRRTARQEGHGNERLSEPGSELQYREITAEKTSITPDSDASPSGRQFNFFSLLVPTAFAALAGVIALGVLHLAGMADILNYQNGFKKAVNKPEKISAPNNNTFVKVTKLGSEAKAQSPVTSEPQPKEVKEEKPELEAQPPATNQDTSATPPQPSDSVAASEAKTTGKPGTDLKKIGDNTSHGQKAAPKQALKPALKPQITKINPIMANVMERGEFPELKLSPSAPKKEPKATSKPTQPTPSSKPVVGYLARENLDSFLSAKTLKERLPYILENQRSASALKGSSLAKPFMPVKSVRLLETLSGPENNMVLHRYMLKFEDPTQRGKRLNIIALLVERIGKHPPLIQAKAFLEHYDKSLSQYAQKPKPEAATYHCIAEASNYDANNALPEDIKSSLVRLTIKSHPYYPAQFDAYLSKNSPLMSHVGSGKSFPYTTSKYAVLSFKWNTTSAKPYIELVDIINHDGWHE
jgi:hypothetical protein